MTRFEKRILLGLGILLSILAVLEAMVPSPTDWTASYSRFHERPYGALHVYEALTDLFPDVRPVHDSPYALATGRETEGAVNLIYINSSLQLGESDTERLLSMVRSGDHLFLATEQLHGRLADTLKVSIGGEWWNDESDTVDIRFIGEPRMAPGVFRFSRGMPDLHFTRYDSSRTRVIAVNGGSRPVLLRMAWGEGSIVLSSNPRAFTNYNLLKGKNAIYMAGAFSLLPYRPVYWDEFFKVGRLGSRTPLRYILSQPPLRWAWYMALALIVLFIFTHARRQQRPIPIMAPLRNATRDLTHTIGRSYWHRGDHAGLARRMIMHFKEEVRERAYMRAFGHDVPSIAHLAAKTGWSEEEVSRRLRSILDRENAQRLTEKELLELSRELHEFKRSL